MHHGLGTILMSKVQSDYLRALIPLFFSFNFILLAQVLRNSLRQSLCATRSYASTSATAGGPSFGLNDEQLEMQEVARKFAREEIIPVAAKLDQTGEYPWDIIKKSWSLGLLNGHIPAHVGGMDLGILTGCVIAEELAYGCTGVKTAMEASGLGVSNIGSGFYVAL